MIFGLNGRFANRKCVIFAKMGDSRRENACFLHKWGVCKEKTCVFRLNGGFAKRKRMMFPKMGDLKRENA